MRRCGERDSKAYPENFGMTSVADQRSGSSLTARCAATPPGPDGLISGRVRPTLYDAERPSVATLSGAPG